MTANLSAPTSNVPSNSHRHSIFLRVYIGSVVLCLFVVLFCYLLLQGINEERAHAYRQNIATGVFSVASAGLERTPDAFKGAWLREAGVLFGERFLVVSPQEADLDDNAHARLMRGMSVVQDISGGVQVYHALNDGNLLSVQVHQVGERQIRAMAAFLVEDLAFYPSIDGKMTRLNKLAELSDFDYAISEAHKLQLSQEQFNRLSQEEIVISYREGNLIVAPSVYIYAPLGDGQVVSVGMRLFDYLSGVVLLALVVLGMVLISVGVYFLVFPLESRLVALRRGIDYVSKGKFDQPVQVIGYDEIADVSATFNNMTTQIKRLIDAQRELTRAVSHELRTPVARIRFAVDMMADENDAQVRLAQLEEIDSDIGALNELIDEILTYAKLEEGAPTLEWQMVDLANLLTQIHKETQALGKPLALIVDGTGNAMADRRYLHRVVQNLVGNALRYAKTQVRVSAGVESGMAFVSVEDDGHGIEEKDRNKVFLPFARLDDSRTRASGGYGLGLSIVSRIAFWFGGQMSVDESPSLGGARFCMRWPVRPMGRVVGAPSEASGEKI